jgi:uridine monophosphate synthetase
MLDTQYIQSLKNVIFSKLIHLGMIKTGTFTLKSGEQTNIYMDLRQLVNYPQFFSYLTKLLYLEHPELITILANATTKLIPIPLGGLPFGFHLASSLGLPLLMIRDKAKDHGTKRMIEGVITPSTDQYILIEDVITSGSSIITALDNITSTLTPIPDCVNNMKAIICICNRGNMKSLRNIPIYSIITLAELQIYISNSLAANPPSLPISYFKYGYGHPFSSKLYQLALEKKSNIILSCDFITNAEILKCLELIGHNVIAVKLHLDILESSSYSQFITNLKLLKGTYNFLIIEDAKYSDIDSIMIEKINNSQLGINKVADAFTMHAIAGLTILEGNKLNIPGIIVAEMSSSNNMITTEYTRQIVDTIRNTTLYKTQHPSNSPDIDIETQSNTQSQVALELSLALGGLVCQSQIPKMLEPFEIATMSPGVNLNATSDGYNQNYKVPQLADNNGNRLGLFWIVGRGITIHKNNLEKLKEVMNKYQSTGWEYFIKY